MKKAGLILLCIMFLISCKKKMDEDNKFSAGITQWNMSSMYIIVCPRYSHPYDLKINLIINDKVKTIVNEHEHMHCDEFYYEFDTSEILNHESFVKVEIIFNDKYTYSQYVFVE